MNQGSIAQSTSSQGVTESAASNSDIEAAHNSHDRKGNKRSRDDDDEEEISRLRQEIKKLKQQLQNNSVMRYANLKDGDIRLQLDGGTKSSSVNPKNHEEAEHTIKSDVWSTKFDLSEIMSTLSTEVAMTTNSKLFANKSGNGSKALV